MFSRRFFKPPVVKLQNFSRDLVTEAIANQSPDYQTICPDYKIIEKKFHFNRIKALVFFEQLLNISLEATPHCIEISITLNERILICIPDMEGSCWMLKNCQETRKSLDLLNKLAELAKQEKKGDLAFLIQMKVPDMPGRFNDCLGRLLEDYQAFENGDNKPALNTASLF